MDQLKERNQVKDGGDGCEGNGCSLKANGGVKKRGERKRERGGEGETVVSDNSVHFDQRMKGGVVVVRRSGVVARGFHPIKESPHRTRTHVHVSSTVRSL